MVDGVADAADRSATVAFDLLPAIDLRDGRVVRLRQGDFARETAYSDNAAAVASAFSRDGARWLHVVDLDGARQGTPRAFSIVGEILDAVGPDTRVELAGGLRTEATVEAALALGAARVVLGTAVLADPDLAARLIRRHGAGRIAVALDVRDGRVAAHGWDPSADGAAVDVVLDRLADLGVETFEVTAIERDGELSGPDLELLGRLVARGRGRVVASAGIASVDDVLAVRALGCSGVILGRALYEGRVQLPGLIDSLAGEHP